MESSEKMNIFNMKRKLLLFMVLSLYAVILSELSSSEVVASELNTEKATVKITPESYLEQYLEAFNNQDEEAAYRLWIHGEDSEKARKSFTDLFSGQVYRCFYRYQLVRLLIGYLIITIELKKTLSKMLLTVQSF